MRFEKDLKAWWRWRGSRLVPEPEEKIAGTLRLMEMNLMTRGMNPTVSFSTGLGSLLSVSCAPRFAAEVESFGGMRSIVVGFVSNGVVSVADDA